MNEIKAPNIKIKLNIKNDQVGQVEEGFFDTSPLKLIQISLTGRTSLSHVVGLLKVYYLLSYAGSTLGQHCCMVATANIYKSQ